MGLFDKIFGKALTFDFSDSAQNSISQESIDYLNSLPEGTTIRVIGLFNRLFHRPDMQRFSEVEVELLDVRFRVYNAMSRVTEERSRQTGELHHLAHMVGLDAEPAGEEDQNAIA